MKLETLAIHTGRTPDSSGGVTPSIVMSTTFARDDSYAVLGADVYGRVSNPNRRALEQSLAVFEGAVDACAFSSGMAAVNAIMQSLQSGDHVILPHDSYFATRSLVTTHFERWGLSFDIVDMTNVDNTRAALRPNTALVWIETPSNPTIAITDIAATAALAAEHGAMSVADNTFASPFGQRPLDLGVDVVMHSTTKFFGGHSDVTGGALMFREANELSERVRSIQGLGGAVPSPFDCWLLHRSLPTMAYRMRAQTDHATQVVAFLDAHPGVERVYYPGLASHPGHAIAAQQMQLFGSMLSFDVVGGRDAALRVANRLKLFTRATSLGGYESLIEHRATVEGAGSVAPPALLRCSIGLEHPDDLIADLEQALA